MQGKLIVAAFFFTSNLAIAAPTDDIKALLDEGKAEEAYQRGHQNHNELGNPAFDFYYGIACIDAGHASEGVLALERYVLNFPANARSRLELARGYFLLGDDTRAREEFEAVDKLNPPAEVRTTIERYVDAIRTREAQYQTNASFFVEGGLGSDSNVNGGVSNANITLPVFGNVQVDDSGVRSGDTFGHFAVGAQASTPMASGASLIGGLNYDSKLNQADKAFDQESIGGFGGITFRRDSNFFRVTGTANTVSVGRNRYRDILGVTGEWLHQLDELQSFNGYFQYAELDYVGTNQVRDARLSGIGAGYRRAIAGGWQPVLSVGTSLSEESNRCDRPDLGRDIVGLTLGVSLSPHPKWGINLGYTYQDSRYSGIDAILNSTRHDTNQALNLTAIYLYDKNISIRSELGISDNRSNLALYSFSRVVGTVNIRYDFK